MHTSVLKNGPSTKQNEFKNYVALKYSPLLSFQKKIRPLASRDPILWLPENSRQIRDDRDSRLPAILLISDFLDPNFSRRP